MVEPAFIELKNITCNKGAGKGGPEENAPLLNNLNMVIGSEQTGLIGANGCGKTTLFRIIVGLEKPDSGQIFFKGKEVTQPQGLSDLRRETGYLFQHADDQLFSPTVLEDIAFGPLNLGFSPEEARGIAMQTLKKLGLEGFEKRVPHKLSGGEKKLVALATVLAMKPSLLLLDEPTNDLDPSTREQLITILKELNHPRVIISHDWDFLAETTSSLYTIDNGRLALCDQAHVHEHRHIHLYGDKPHSHNP